jgi:membrane peptidoglycan carboxypeptidase
LNAKEGAFLAMLLPSPRKYAISFRHGELTPYARKIMHSILNKMVMAHYLTVEEKDQEWKIPLSFEKNVDISIPADELNDDEDEVESPNDLSDPQPIATPVQVDAD